MNSEQQAVLKDLLTTQRVLSLAVLLDGRPYVGLLPFVMRGDLSAALIHASGLARHTRGLGEGAPFSALIQTPDRPDLDPLQLPRVTLEGRVRVAVKDSEAYASGRILYLGRFPSSSRTFMLGDFNLYELVVEKGRFVAGFGSAHTVTPEVLAGLLGEGGVDEPRDA